MYYANPWMLAGLAAVAIPVIIHLFTQHRARRVSWGAMRFLMESVVHRNRRMVLEQVLLLIVRCLMVALVALAMALPFVGPDSRVPWPFVLPAVLIGAAAVGAGSVLGAYPRWRWGLFAGGALLLLVAGGATVAEQWMNVSLLSRPAGSQDVAIIIDGSDSMRLAVDGPTNFERAVDEALAIVDALKGGDGASVILAGSRALPKTSSPLPRGDDLRRTIAELRVVGGSMSIHDALAAAATTLARGQNTAKRIVVITDGQSVGWKQDGKVDWKSLGDELTSFNPAPTVVLRRLGLPRKVKNVQIAELAVSGGVIGPDRDTTVAIRVENQGTEPITDAFDVELRLNGSDEALRTSVPGLAPGASESVSFGLPLGRGGLHSLEASAVLADDMPWDSSAARVVQAFDRLPVLVVDGNPAFRPHDRAAWFIELALAPDPDERRGAGSDAESAAERGSGLFAVTIIDASKIETIQRFDDYRAVVLADVSKLPIRASVALAQYVADGGGLLVAAGSRCDPAFYNRWQSNRGQPLLGAELVERRVADDKRPAAHPTLGTLDKTGLTVLADAANSDLGSATITAYWKLKPVASDDQVQVRGMLDTGDPLLVERKLGQGRVILTAASLDSKGSNLPSLQTFLPLVQELVLGLMRLKPAELEFLPPLAQSIELPSPPTVNTAALSASPTAAGQGLRGEYFADAEFGRRVVERIDPNVAFTWGDAVPAEGVPNQKYSVRWTGTLLPAESGNYQFTVEGDRAGVWLNGKRIASSAPVPKPLPPTQQPPNAKPPEVKPSEPSAPVELEAGRPYALRVEYDWQSKPGGCRLFWESKTIPRQPVPTQVLLPTEAWQKELANASDTSVMGAVGLSTTWLGPEKTRGRATLRSADGRLLAGVEGAEKPGLYRLEMPPTLRDPLRHLAIADAVPLAIRSVPAESGLAMLGDDDLSDAAPAVRLEPVSSRDELLSALGGGVPGHRLWKYLAIGALALAVGEIALARWIATQRRLQSMPEVDFETVKTPTLPVRGRADQLFADLAAERRGKRAGIKPPASKVTHDA